jgi:hypothetical protein
MFAAVSPAIARLTLLLKPVSPSKLTGTSFPATIKHSLVFRQWNKKN